MGPPPIVLRDGSFRGQTARSAVYPLNEAHIAPGGRDSASLRPIGTQDAKKASVAPKGCSLSRSPLNAMKDIHENRKIKEIIGLVLVFLIFAPIFYWRIFGFKPLDNFFDKFQNDYPLVFYPLLFALLIFFLGLSWKEYRKGDDFELIRVLLYGFFVVVILLGLTLGVFGI